MHLQRLHGRIHVEVGLPLLSRPKMKAFRPSGEKAAVDDSEMFSAETVGAVAIRLVHDVNLVRSVERVGEDRPDFRWGRRRCTLPVTVPSPVKALVCDPRFVGVQQLRAEVAAHIELVARRSREQGIGCYGHASRRARWRPGSWRSCRFRWCRLPEDRWRSPDWWQEW